MKLRHLALAVTDEQRSREFYERWFQFGVAPPRRYPDGVLMLYGPGDVALALGPAEERPALPAFLHFGFTLDDPDAVASCMPRSRRPVWRSRSSGTSPTTSASRSGTPTATWSR
jgi:catechol 2,3-dioxygenase-like lactoylglutathione lyase family enzyme